MLLDHLLFFQEERMVDLYPNLPHPGPLACTFVGQVLPLPHPIWSTVAISQETKGKRWLFHRKTLAKDLNGGANLLSSRKQKDCSWLMFLSYSKQEAIGTSAFSSLFWKWICDHGSCSVVLRQGCCCCCYCIFHLEDVINPLLLSASVHCVQWQWCTEFWVTVG